MVKYTFKELEKLYISDALFDRKEAAQNLTFDICTTQQERKDMDYMFDVLAMDDKDIIRYIIAGNKETPETYLKILSKDDEIDVIKQVIMNPSISDEIFNDVLEREFSYNPLMATDFINNKNPLVQKKINEFVLKNIENSNFEVDYALKIEQLLEENEKDSSCIFDVLYSISEEVRTKSISFKPNVVKLEFGE